MDTSNQSAPDQGSFMGLLHELGGSAKNLVLDQIKLVKLQIESVGDDISRQLKLLVVFACLAILSILPIIAAAIIALGKFLDDRYWLSSLIVGVVCCIASSLFVNRALSKIKEDALVVEESVKENAVNVTKAIEGAV